MMSRTKKIFYDIIILLLILNISQSSVLGTRYIPFMIGIILLFISLIKKEFKANKSYLAIIFLWIAINITIIISTQITYNIFRFIIMTMNLLILPYLLLNILKKYFWERFEGIVFLLTQIGIILYVLNIIFQTYFNGLLDLFASLTAQSFLVNHNYWSALIYVNAFADNGYGINRNSGFMWEPGAFAMMIIWGIVYNFLKNGVKYDKKIIIYIIALITTFSTAGYLAFFVIFITKYIKKITIWNIIVITIVLYLSSTIIYKLDFISTKLESYTTTFIEDPTGKSGNIDRKVNRFQGFVTSIQRTFKHPFGYGLLSAKDRNEINYSYGTNGIGSLIEKWGFLGFLYLFYLMRKSLVIFDNYNVKKITINLFLISIIIMFFSNPIAVSIFIYFLVIYPTIYKQENLRGYFN